MNVIELNIDFSIKKDPNNIKNLLSKLYKEVGQEDNVYKRRINKEWSNQAKQIQTLNCQKYLLAYEVYSERKYFLFRNEENTCVNGKGQLRCIIISSEDYKDCEQNIRLVIGRIKEILGKEIRINIDYESSCKIYICNPEEGDIVSSEFYLRAALKKQRIWSVKKNKIKFIGILIILAIILTSICWKYIGEYANSLSLAIEEQSKAIISSKISILVNLFTGLYGTIIIEGLILIYEVVVLKTQYDFTFNIDYDITKSNVEKFNRKGLMHTIGDDLEQGLDITTVV